MARRYEMTGRTAAMHRTREAILDAAVDLFTRSWFDEVTMADVARQAQVSQQTVVNHFGTKIDLYLTGLAERYVPGVVALRETAEPGDLDSIVDVVVEDYETTGDSTIRILALAARSPELAPIVEGGRLSHAEFVARVFAPDLARRRGRNRARLARLLAAALDVRTWHQLRREQGLTVDDTRAHLRHLVEALLAA